MANLFEYLLNKIFKPKFFDEKKIFKIVDIQNKKLDLLNALIGKRIKLTSEPHSFFHKRVSIRNFSGKALNKEYFSEIIFNSLGIRKDKSPKKEYSLEPRTFPSAGGLNLIESAIYVHNVSGIEKGIYLYNPYTEELILLKSKVLLEDLLPYCQNINLNQANFVIFFISNIQPGMIKYGLRSYRYVLLEAGHAAQNILLNLPKYGLGGVCLGAFNDKKLRKELNILKDYQNEYVVVCGGIK